MEVVYSFLLPVFLGAGHVLEPGHGKTALTLFATRARMNSRFIISLMAGIVLSHTLVLLLTALVLSLIAFERDDFHILHAVFGGVGSLILFWVAWRVLPRSSGKGEHDHGDHEPGSTCSCPAHQGDAAAKKKEAGTAGLIGMGGGLLPCPTAVAAFMTSLSSGAVLEAVGAIFAFILGMVITLLALALAANFLGSRFLNFQGLNRRRHAYLLALAIAAAGIVSLVMPLRELGLLSF